MSFLLGGILSGLGSLVKAGVGIYQNHLANKIHPQYNPYQTSQYAQQKLGMAQQSMNGRMPGATSQQNNILASGANTMNNISRNATDGSQALALASGVQGQEDAAFDGLSTKEGAYSHSLLDNINNAYDTMTAEGDKLYKDKLTKYQMDSNTQNQLRGNGMSNLVGAIGDGSSLATQYAMLNKKGYGMASSMTGD